MQLITNFFPNHQSLPASAVTLGNFDGVHRGHQAILTQLIQTAKAQHIPSVVIIFEPQPAEYFAPDSAPVRLSSLREKTAALQALGIDYVFFLKFNQQLAEMPAETFAKHYLFEKLGCRYLLVGQDFRFGCQRKGNSDLLQALAPAYQARVQVFQDYLEDDKRISSTAVRQSLLRGDLALSRCLLGRHYSIIGKVVPGHGKGREWGVPTANIALGRRKPPIAGVFCVQVRCNEETYPGVANVGIRPTLDGTRCILEVHLLNADKDLYGRELQVFFLHKLRDEVKFENLQALIKQIHLDVELAKQFFKEI